MLVVGVNLALDRTLLMSELVPGHVQRPRSAEATAGGKAVNVCRAARAHQLRPRLVANLPGRLGEFVGDLLDGEGHDVRRVPTDGEARSATIVIEDGGRVTVLNEPGPPLTPEHRTRVVAAVHEEARGRRIAVVSGSLPPGDSAGLYADLVDAAHRQGCPVVLDAARQDLRDALAAGPDVVTPNLAEATAVLHGTAGESVEPEGPTAREDTISAALALRDAGAKAALVTAGRHGVGGADAEGTFWVSAPQVAEVNPIGAGDAFASGLAVGLARGEDLRTACVRAVATAAASVTTALAGEVNPVLLHDLLPTIRWERR